jgi:hypothetical protein
VAVTDGANSLPSPEDLSRVAPSGPAPWYKRRAVLWSAAVVAIVAAAVISDLPEHTSRGDQISAATTVMNEVNGDIGPCVYAVGEAFLIRNQQDEHTLSPADAPRVPGLLRDDQDACAFTDSYINDLANVEVPGSAVGRDLGDVVSSVTLWASDDALTALEAVQTLTAHPGDASAQAKLSSAVGLLASDRASAVSQLAAAEHLLDTRLPALDLPVLPLPH